MAEKKTKQTDASVAAYLAAIGDERRRTDCEALAALMAGATKEPAAMWGTAIVGFGRYRYKYESGREGEMCLVGFSSRKSDISIYLPGSFPGRDEALAKLGRHKTAKACLYLRTLADVDLGVLRQMVVDGAAERRRAHA